ncbi:MAG: hypothetical protein IJM15_06310, partial [Erysipelotrichaceae bacterium]|nr:hypothetical protein [Erysipelotrichaceae bacterium]
NGMMLKKRKGFLAVLLLALLLAGSVLFYIGDYYHADEDALKAMASEQIVKVEERDYGWFFDGTGEDHILIFYPGAKVEEKAYAPLLHLLAERGIDVCLVKMPAHLAVLGINKAEKVMAQHECMHWYIGGHSLGGAVASIFCEKHEAMEALILLAAYPNGPLDKNPLTVSIYGSNDGVLNMEKYRKKIGFADDLIEYVIEGGNHAQFGSYGDQKKDKTAEISSARQIEETAEMILQALGLE